MFHLVPVGVLPWPSIKKGALRVGVVLVSFLLIYVLYFLQFDYLKSLEIEEKINKIRWCQTANGALFLLSTNDKTIKFWKVS